MVRISSLDSSWSLFRPEKMPVADGERLRVTGKFPDSASPAVTACRWHPSVKMR
ncbi:traI domain protein [Escherichia coli P0304777.9]|nr:traI domain protein [Escherichia coli P0304777.9]ENF07750.1 traI domain protein [Escherichia coli P0304777.9]